MRCYWCGREAEELAYGKPWCSDVLCTGIEGLYEDALPREDDENDWESDRRLKAEERLFAEYKIHGWDYENDSEWPARIYKATAKEVIHESWERFREVVDAQQAIQRCKGCGAVYDPQIATLGTYVDERGVAQGANPHQPCGHASCAFACRQGCAPEIAEA